MERQRRSEGQGRAEGQEGKGRHGVAGQGGAEGRNGVAGEGGAEGRNRKKEVGYRLFAAMYSVFRFFPARRNQVFSVMTHDASETGNVRMLERYMASQQEKPPYRFCHLEKAERDGLETGADWRRAGMCCLRLWRGLSGVCRFFLVKPYQMARAQYILMDNAFLPMAYFRVRKGTRVVQLWHGTGTIKKFGQDATKGWLRLQEQRINRNITHLIVNAPALRCQYAKAFGVPEGSTYATGLPRTDALVEWIGAGAKRGGVEEAGEAGSRRAEAKLYQVYPQLKGKKLILYAPTFRDAEGASPRLHMDVRRLCGLLPEEYVLLLRLHPFVAAAFEEGNAWVRQEGRLCQVSGYGDLPELMGQSEALITDYSSIVFDYALFDKPMYFCTDDLEEFSDSGRGFYEPYESFVPGPVFAAEEELANYIRNGTEEEKKHWQQKRQGFVAKYYDRLDGHATERVFRLIAAVH